MLIYPATGLLLSLASNMHADAYAKVLPTQLAIIKEANI